MNDGSNKFGIRGGCCRGKLELRNARGVSRAKDRGEEPTNHPIAVPRAVITHEQSISRFQSPRGATKPVAEEVDTGGRGSRFQRSASKNEFR